MKFDRLGLDDRLLETVASQGYEEATAIQAEAIPLILAGRDLLGGSQTGTGKTAAFALPILDLLSRPEHKSRNPRCLILAPTRELADQVEKSVRTYSRGMKLYSLAIYGGTKLPPQIRQLRQGVDILVATPGRLLDHVDQKNVDLGEVEILVLDEADRMLDMGFMPDIKRIIKLLPKQRQNLLFSATYSKEIRSLADGLLHDPASVEVTPRNTAAELVTQIVHPVEKTRKRDLLIKLIRDGDWRQVLVFARTRHGAQRLSVQLTKKGIEAAAIHGDKSQNQRTRALDAFKKGKVRVLVATDVAARGLDIQQLPHVVNFDMPQVAEDYVHRIGRTGRAGEEGAAHSLVCAAEAELLAGVEQVLGRAVKQVVVEGFEGEALVFTGAPSKKQRGGGGGQRRGGPKKDTRKGNNGSRRRRRRS